MLERALELEASVGLRMVAATRHPWRDRSKDHGETQETRQGSRRSRALTNVCAEGKAGSEAEGKSGCGKDAEAVRHKSKGASGKTRESRAGGRQTRFVRQVQAVGEAEIRLERQTGSGEVRVQAPESRKAGPEAV